MVMHSPSHSNKQASHMMQSGPAMTLDFSARNWNFAATAGSSTISPNVSRGFISNTVTGHTSRQWEHPVHLACWTSTETMDDLAPLTRFGIKQLHRSIRGAE